MNEGTPIIIKKKKGHGGHAHHGGSWKVAYADFVTAMMAFFMVMWIMGLSDQSRAQIAGYFNDPLGFEKNMPNSKNVINIKTAPPQDQHKVKVQDELASDDVKQVEEEKKLLQKALDTSSGDLAMKDIIKQVEVTITSEGLQIEFIESTGAVFFESGSAIVRPVAKELVAKIAPIIEKSGRKLIIEGHTDSIKYPSETYSNWDLSADRANALRRLLVADGVADKAVLQVRGYADTKLKRPDDPTHFSNRRVTVLLPFKDVTNPILDLPKEEFKHEKEAVFRQSVNLAPSQPDITAPAAKPYWDH